METVQCSDHLPVSIFPLRAFASLTDCCVGVGNVRRAAAADDEGVEGVARDDERRPDVVSPDRKTGVR